MKTLKRNFYREYVKKSVIIRKKERRKIWKEWRSFESLIRLKYHLYIRLHREALKQSAIDPLSGKIDISILTTGMSLAARKRRQELVEALKNIIKGKDKAPNLNYQKVFTELKESSNVVSFTLLLTIMFYVVISVIIIVFLLFNFINYLLYDFALFYFYVAKSMFV